MDWIRFLRSNHIPYATSGAHTTKGWVEIKCPFCGSADPSMHMGIKLRGKRWNCWRNVRHSGTDPAQLIQQLLGCSYAEALSFFGEDAPVGLQDHETTAQLWKHLGVDLEVDRQIELSLGREGLYPLRPGLFSRPAYNYMEDRGYRGSELDWIIKNYDLHYTTTGQFAHRVTFPIWDRSRRLLTWVGRSVRKKESLRYLAQPVTKREGFQQVAHVATKQALLGLPLLWRCEDPQVLVICEGPFDAIRITSVGRMYGVWATCLFGLTVSPEQMTELVRLRRRFPATVMLLDAGTGFQPFRLSNSGLDCYEFKLPPEIDDPGEMTGAEALTLCEDLLRLANRFSLPIY